MSLLVREETDERKEEFNEAKREEAKEREEWAELSDVNVDDNSSFN